jgi:diaminopimelate decarboxylase
MQQPSFLDPERTRAVARQFGTPVYVYDQASLEAACGAVTSFPNAFGLTPRYAMKALPTAGILRLVHARGLRIDASSGFEARRAIFAGIPPEHIQVTAQELPRDFAELIEQGVEFAACSLHQLRAYGERFPDSEVTVRINPGTGSGHNNRTNVGGPGASFGIWHGLIADVLAVAKQYRVRITGMHTHIGSGGDPEVWKHCARLSLNIAAKLPDVTTLSLGGGFKIARMPGEPSADLQEIGTALLPDFEQFARDHGRELHIEVEPGTYLTANAGALIAGVSDVVTTKPEGYDFIKLDTGMSEILRPSMYGAQHPMALVPNEDEDRAARDYIVVGHCCESGDILTPAPGEPEALQPRTLVEAKVGDLLVIGGAGAYCSSMCAKNYNSFPEAPEVLIENNGTLRLIRARQALESIVERELA